MDLSNGKLCSDEVDDEEPNFDLALNTDDLFWVGEEEPNFDIGLNSDDLYWVGEEEPNFDMDMSFEDEDNQMGGGDDDDDAKYHMELVRHRNIPKFSIQGFDYRVRVDAIDSSVTYATAVQILHSVLAGKCNAILNLCNIHYTIKHKRCIYILLHL